MPASPSEGPHSTPDVLFLGHGAERSGPPIFLLTFQGWLAEHAPWTFATVLGRGGALLPEFEALAEVRVVDRRWTTPRILQQGLHRLSRPTLADRLTAARDRAVAGRLARAETLYVNTIAPETLRLFGSLVRSDHRVVVHVHEMAAALRHRVDPAALAHLLARADGVVAASQAVADHLVVEHEVAPGRIAVHHELVVPVPPVPVGERAARRRALGLDPDALVVVGSGRLEWRKAPDLFVALAARLTERVEAPVQLVWVGGDTTGPDLWPLDHEVRHLGLEDVVRFVGEVVRPGDWFAVADVFAQVAREDAYPIACLEAASAGVPLVTFDTGGMVEFAARGGGVVVGYPDVEAFADEVVALVGDADRHAALGRAAAAAAADHVAELAAPALVATVASWR